MRNFIAEKKQMTAELQLWLLNGQELMGPFLISSCCRMVMSIISITCSCLLLDSIIASCEQSDVVVIKHDKNYTSIFLAQDFV